MNAPPDGRRRPPTPFLRAAGTWPSNILEGQGLRPRPRRWLGATACAAAAVLCVAAAGCTGMRMGRGAKKVVSEDFAEGRVVDVSITERITGNREMLFMSMPRKTLFLDGYIQGVITDYLDNPVQGVVVRAVAVGEGAQKEETGERRSGFAGSSFDPGVSDTNGFYRIRFSLPIIDGVVDVRGRVLYSPGWEQERDNLGKAYEPQQKQSQFRVYYELKRARITFTEGIRKTVVAPVTSGAPPKAAALPSAGKPAVEKAPGAPAEGGGDEDLFKGFGFEGP
ncbi:MAG: hypothetical protein HY748_01055 [Elusimicrobia bacterium]|nr:hypothetical protein [Elusimicrobiota bacterium]